MSLFDLIEKLITEHGSAAVLRDQLHAFTLQISMLEKKNVELEAKVQNCEIEKEHLKNRIKDLEQTIEELTHDIPPASASSNEEEIPRWKKIRRLLKGDL